MKNSEMMNDWTACHDCETCGRYAGVVFVCGAKCTIYIGSFRIILQATVRNCAGMLSALGTHSRPAGCLQNKMRIRKLNLYRNLHLLRRGYCQE